jgi:hypothetical protein
MGYKDIFSDIDLRLFGRSDIELVCSHAEEQAKFLAVKYLLFSV